MNNQFGITEKELESICKRDSECVYCHKKMIYPFDIHNRKDSATIEHLNEDGPFYWDEGLKIEDVVMACGSCNSSRGKKKLQDRFKGQYCVERNINENTVSFPVKEYLKRRK